MNFKQNSFSQVKKTEEYSSFIIRLILGSVATIFAGFGSYNDVLQISTTSYFLISFSFFFITFAIFIDLFRQLVSPARRYFTLTIDIFYTSISIYFTAGETEVIWLFYIWLYIGYGMRYGKNYLLVARFLAMSQYAIVIYMGDLWKLYPLDLLIHMLILFFLPYYILSMIKRLHLAKTEAIKMAKLKTHFLTSMSHEIRTPLNGVIGTTHLLSRTELNPRQQKFVDALLFSAKILLGLINNILDFSKIEANRIELSKDTIAIRQCLKDITQTLLFTANKKQTRLSYQIDNRVPELIIGDQNRLIQILLNLAGNAIKFTANGQVSILVKLKNKTKKSCHLLFQVKDTGIGISENDQKIIFNRYTQLENNSGMTASGTGLGTSICKELIEKMGGSIQLKSESGKGSEFSFDLLFDLPEKCENNQNKPILASSDLTDSKKLHILIAEDDDINAMVLEQFLLDLGHSSNRVSNGKQVLEQLGLQHYDLIFMDLHMPELSGLQACKKIRSQDNNINIIGLTANATKEHQLKCMKAGMNDFLSKPVTPDSLEGILKKFSLCQ